MTAGPLEPLPPDFAATRAGLHRLAEEVVKVAREHATCEFSLIATPGGFGTPAFGPNQAQVRVDGGDLVVKVGDEEQRREAITSLRAAGELAAGLLPEGLDLDDESLGVRPEAALALGRWYAFGEDVLERLRADARAGDEPSAVTLWPEHLDIAIEMGPEGEGRRANYGLSPGDEAHEEPYLYVGPWTARPSGELWKAQGFPGAELAYAELAGADDQLAAALDFCRRRKEALDAITEPERGLDGREPRKETFGSGAEG